MKLVTSNREFFTRIGGEFNRLNDLLQRMRCRECGNYMRAVSRYARWKGIKGINQLVYEHFAVFAAMTFSCQHDDCKRKGKPVYLSYCWHCHEPIDSRDNPIRIKGYYLCKKCGAGYRDFAGNDRYAIYPGTICPSCNQCPKCSGQNFDVTQAADGKFRLRCVNCRQIMTVPNTLQDITPNKESRFQKYECSDCGQKLEFNNERLDRQLSNISPVIWA